MKLRLHSVENVSMGYQFFCPGCDCLHYLRVMGTGPIWKFDGNVAEPTFTPSLRYFHPAIPAEKIPERTICHLYLRKGVIEFLTDCTHALKGKKVPLVEIDEQRFP